MSGVTNFLKKLRLGLSNEDIIERLDNFRPDVVL
jgi:hypothetical protein